MKKRKVLIVLMAILMAITPSCSGSIAGWGSSPPPSFSNEEEAAIVAACKDGTEDVLDSSIKCSSYIWPQSAVAACSVDPNAAVVIEDVITQCKEMPSWQSKTTPKKASASVEIEPAQEPAEEKIEEPDDTPEPPSVATTAPSTTFGETQSFADGLITISGFPKKSSPVRWGGGVVQENKCGEGAEEACWIITYDGVISYDHQTAENKNNKSAIWSGGANVDNLLENVTGTYTCPEGGYMKVTYPQALIIMEQLELSVEVKASAETNYTFLSRCLYAEESGESTDRNIIMDFFTKHPGRVKVMRYPVDPAWSGFFSFDHLEEDLANGHGQLRGGADNCGNSGCNDSYVILLDLNHKTIAIYSHTVKDGWVLLHSNATKPS